jgi:phosphoenolpyruvate-protein kinase (PTS system EI component)
MTPRDIPPVKETIREHAQTELADLARRALLLEGPAEVRALAGDL